MKIDSVDISDFGLSVLRADDYLNFPGRKQILDEPAFTANDIKLKSNEFKVELFGKWDTLSGLRTSLNSLDFYLIQSLKHTIEIPENNIPELTDVVFKDGYSVDYLESNGVVIAKITLRVTATNLINSME